MRGVGGTRNCDWWFTDQAVLIDTAGRYTTQDSDRARGRRRLARLPAAAEAVPPAPAAQRRAAWRSAWPTSPPSTRPTRHAHARTIRRRIRELHDELGVRVPVYVLFTKADLIAGFVEFFDNLGKEEREQVWGMTFPLDDGKRRERRGRAVRRRVRRAARRG